MTSLTETINSLPATEEEALRLYPPRLFMNASELAMWKRLAVLPESTTWGDMVLGATLTEIKRC